MIPCKTRRFSLIRREKKKIGRKPVHSTDSAASLLDSTGSEAVRTEPNRIEQIRVPEHSTVAEETPTYLKKPEKS
jgi:hypothetical protein